MTLPDPTTASATFMAGSDREWVSVAATGSSQALTTNAAIVNRTGSSSSADGPASPELVDEGREDVM